MRRTDEIKQDESTMQIRNAIRNQSIFKPLIFTGRNLETPVHEIWLLQFQSKKEHKKEHAGSVRGVKRNSERKDEEGACLCRFEV